MDIRFSKHGNHAPKMAHALEYGSQRLGHGGFTTMNGNILIFFPATQSLRQTMAIPSIYMQGIVTSSIPVFAVCGKL